MVAFRETGPPPPDGYQPHRDFGSDLPKITPLFGFLPMLSLGDRRGLEVFLKRAPGRVVLTWRYPKTPEVLAFARTQLVLHESGVISFTYRDLDEIEVAPFVQVGLRSGALRGLNPGGAAPRLEPVALSTSVPFIVPAGAGVIDDMGLRFRQYMHSKSIRKAPVSAWRWQRSW